MSYVKFLERDTKKAKFGQKLPEFKDAIIRQPAQPVQIDQSDGTLWYGTDNAFPLNLATLVQESPSAASCISVLSDFLEGRGFSDAALGRKIINSHGQTFSDIHSLVSDAFAIYEGFTLLVKYTLTGQISEIFSVPFENVRLNKPDDKGIISKVTLNPYYGTGIFRRQDNVCYDVFNPDPKVVREQMVRDKNKYKGQIMYVAITRPLSRFYPQPYYYSAKHWMAIDAKIGEYHENNLDAGFFQMVLLKMVGDPNAPSTHPDDQRTNDAGTKESFRTVGERFDLEMQKFTGSDSKTKAMVLWEMMKDQLPSIEPFPSIDNENFFVAIQDFVSQNILRAMKIPGILANMSKDNSLSDGNQMANATKVMHDRVAKPQNMLERAYESLLSRFKEPYTEPVKIINTNSFEGMAKIDENVWKSLTLPEQRQWIKENTDYPIIDVAQGPVVQPVQPAITAPAPTNSTFQNVLFTDYPEGAKKVAKRGFDWMTEHPECGTTIGKKISTDIIEGRPMSYATIQKIYRFLNKNRVHENKLFTDSCESCKYASWGGTPMYDYCSDKIKMING